MNFTITDVQRHNEKVAAGAGKLKKKLAAGGCNPTAESQPEPASSLPTSPVLTLKPQTEEEKLNKTERAFLAHQRMLMPDRYIGIQNITLKLADDCRLTPDFNLTWTNNSSVSGR